MDPYRISYIILLSTPLLELTCPYETCEDLIVHSGGVDLGAGAEDGEKMKLLRMFAFSLVLEFNGKKKSGGRPLREDAAGSTELHCKTLGF